MQTKEYLENYWLLNLDFIETFSDLTYQDIPLPLLANFYQYLEEVVREQMRSPEFKRHLGTTTLEDRMIQPSYEEWIHPLKRPVNVRNLPPKGKILLNFDYLRFSEANYKRYFSPENTVIFARWHQEHFLGFPVHCIKHYVSDVSSITNYLVSQANEKFDKVKQHPVYGNTYFRNTFINRIPSMVETIVAINNYLNQHPVSCVVVGTTEDLISRILVILAGARGIPSICMQHGLLGGDEAYLPVFTTKVAIYGEYEKKWYLDRGVSPETLITTGHPQFDDIATEKHMSKKDFLAKYNLDPRKKTILFATQPNYVNLWTELIDIMAKYPQFQILIKPHPWELSRNQQAVKLIEHYKRLEAKYAQLRLVEERGAKLYDILPNVDFVVINLSTVGLEAMLFDKPFCILSNQFFNYYDKLMEFFFSAPSKLADYLVSYFKNPIKAQIAKYKRKKFLEYAYPYRLSGPRLIQEINTLITTGK